MCVCVKASVLSETQELYLCIMFFSCICACVSEHLCVNTSTGTFEIVCTDFSVSARRLLIPFDSHIVLRAFMGSMGMLNGSPHLQHFLYGLLSHSQDFR